MRVEFYDYAEFEQWFDKLHLHNQRRITILLDALEESSTPLIPPAGKNLRRGLHELRLHAGYRIYYGVERGVATVLTQGNKGSQERDIARARKRQ